MEIDGEWHHCCALLDTLYCEPDASDASDDGASMFDGDWADAGDDVGDAVTARDGTVADGATDSSASD